MRLENNQSQSWSSSLNLLFWKEIFCELQPGAGRSVPIQVTALLLRPINELGPVTVLNKQCSH